MANAKHSDPHPVFVGPCKEVIKAALILAGIPEIDIDYSSVERNGAIGARILTSRNIPTTINYTEERPSGSRFATWRSDAGELITRAQRAHMTMSFEVQMWSESLSVATGFLFDFVRHMPRSAFDAMPQMGKAVQTDPGNRIEFGLVNPQLPDETTSTAKQYRSSIIVRADGGLYLDKGVTVQVDTRITMNPNLLP